MSLVSLTPDPIPSTSGIGLRGEHYTVIDEQQPDIGWLEVHTENYFGQGGSPHYYLSRIREHYPLSFHGVGLSIGSADPLDKDHLNRIKELENIYQPGLISEHLSWSSIDQVFLNDLLPLPYTEEALKLVIQKVSQIQNELGRKILIENPSTYVSFSHSTLSETDFLIALATQAECGLLLDVNNVYVSAMNHHFDAKQYLSAIPSSLVGEIHLAGHTVKNFENHTILIDTHNDLISNEVWALYEYAIKLLGKKPTLIEWDSDLPAIQVLLEEANHAQEIMTSFNSINDNVRVA